MQMRDEDGTDLGEAQTGATQLYLCSLTTIDKEQLATHLHHLRRREVFQRGQGTAATKDMDSKGFQNASDSEFFRRRVFQLNLVFSFLLGILAAILIDVFTILID